MRNIDRARFAEFSKAAEEFANSEGFEPLEDSIAGAHLALSAFAGHLLITDERLKESEWLGFLVSNVFLDKLRKRQKGNFQ